MIQADVDGNGTIDYTEFIAATMHKNRMEKEDHLYTAFEYFDTDGSGYVNIIGSKLYQCFVFVYFLISLFLVNK